MRVLALLTLLSLSFVSPAGATDSSVPPQPIPDFVPERTTTLDGQLPAASLPLLRLTPDKIELVRLDADAINVIVGNARHLMAVMETPRQILLIPRAPGATHFQVLDSKGKTILERSVIIAGPKQDYIRVRRACAVKTQGDCTEYSIFYCPDMCHAVTLSDTSQTGSGAKVPTEAASSGTSAPDMIDDQPVPSDPYANAATTSSQALSVP